MCWLCAGCVPTEAGHQLKKGNLKRLLHTRQVRWSIWIVLIRLSLAKGGTGLTDLSRAAVFYPSSSSSPAAPWSAQAPRQHWEPYEQKSWELPSSPAPAPAPRGRAPWSVDSVDGLNNCGSGQNGPRRSSAAGCRSPFAAGCRRSSSAAGRRRSCSAKLSPCCS